MSVDMTLDVSLILSGRHWASIEEFGDTVRVQAIMIDRETGLTVAMRYERIMSFDDALAEITPLVEAEWPNRERCFRAAMSAKIGRSIFWYSKEEPSVGPWPGRRVDG
jgi:hypothetical protein